MWASDSIPDPNNWFSDPDTEQMSDQCLAKKKNHRIPKGCGGLVGQGQLSTLDCNATVLCYKNVRKVLIYLNK
jgi:hypothetical protein